MNEKNRNAATPPPQRHGARRGPHGPGGGPPGMHGGEKAKNFKGTIVKLCGYLKPFGVSLIIVLVFSIISTVFSVIGPKILGNVTTEVAKGAVAKYSGGLGIDFDKVAKMLAQIGILYLISAVFGFLQSWIMSTISQKMSYNFRRQMAEKINRLPLKYFDTKTHGEVLSRVTNDVDTIAQSLGQSLTQIVSSVCTVIGVLWMMLTISGTMTLIAVLIAPLSMVMALFIIKASQKYFKSQQEYIGHVNGHVEEVYGGHLIMKAFNAQESSLKTFDELNGTLYKAAWKSQFLSGVLMPMIMFVGNLGYVAVSIVGTILTIKRKIEVGDIMAFINYVRQFTQPITQTAQIVNILQSTAAAAERVFEFLEETDEAADAVNGANTENIVGTVKFENVSFGYDPEKIIIKDFSATITPGQKIAIVGPTGAGKTTIVKLLMRFYELNGGKITIDGIDIKDFKRDDLRRMIGMVLQDAWLFNGQIIENIRYGRQNATDEEIYAAGKSAHIDHFVKALPNAYHWELNEEASNISQGQKQLLTIARAILADPKILILDEATSSVDTRTEARIQRAMHNLMKGRTSFIIAHRLSTIRDADLILVMNGGDIVEQGSHEELLAANGFYASLYNSQFETGLNEA